MNITLNNLNIRNFKGIKELEIALNGGDACIYGENATGKTTIYDAFLWLLFDKDSTNRKDFAVKPHDANGNEIHFLETSVGASLLIDGRPLDLKKTYSEKWTKKRGEAEQTFSGHESAYWVDGVPKAKGEYTAKIGELVNEDTFKLITNPAYFNTMLTWQQRRAKLFEMAGNLTDDEVIAGNPQFDGLGIALEGHTVDDARTVAKATLRKLNDELKKVPVRIDELTRTLPAVKPNYGELEARAKLTRKMIDSADADLNDARKLADLHMEKVRQLSRLKTKLDDRKRELKTTTSEKQINAQTKLRELENSKNTLEVKADNISRSCERHNEEIAQIETNLIALRKSWNDKYQETIIMPEAGAELCPTCGQALPDDYLESKAEKANVAFESKKATELSAIQIKGKALAKRKETLAAEVATNAKEFEKLRADITKIDAEIEAVRPIAEAAAPEPNYAADDKLVRLEADIAALDDDIQQPASAPDSALLAKRANYQADLDEINRALARRDVDHDARERIKELKAEEKKLAQQIAEQEKLLYTLEQFATYKCTLLEQRINELFPTVRWKLFDTQINGAIVDCCECLIGGVPFADANNAARINAGLEIADVLAKHAEVTAPVFVDNAEAVNELIPISGQTIALLVSSDRELKIEAANKEAA